MELAKLNSVLTSVSGDYKYLHWLVNSGANCRLLPSDSSWEVSFAITGELATPVLNSAAGAALFVAAAAASSAAVAVTLPAAATTVPSVIVAAARPEFLSAAALIR